jgi:hypothetical protein
MHSAQPQLVMPPDAHIQNNHCYNVNHHALPAQVTLHHLLQVSELEMHKKQKMLMF